ncbi:hypothetical protein DFH09DRAFT_1086743 [Mycena vulgaris]|nr:hypothetical protein DFH09DRAFT_1086743 [Mycena vulgaris]
MDGFGLGVEPRNGRSADVSSGIIIWAAAERKIGLWGRKTKKQKQKQDMIRKDRRKSSHFSSAYLRRDSNLCLLNTSVNPFPKPIGSNWFQYIMGPMGADLAEVPIFDGKDHSSCGKCVGFPYHQFGLPTFDVPAGHEWAFSLRYRGLKPRGTGECTIPHPGSYLGYQRAVYPGDPDSNFVGVQRSVPYLLQAHTLGTNAQYTLGLQQRYILSLFLHQKKFIVICSSAEM